MWRRFFKSMTWISCSKQWYNDYNESVYAMYRYNKRQIETGNMLLIVPQEGKFSFFYILFHRFIHIVVFIRALTSQADFFCVFVGLYLHYNHLKSCILFHFFHSEKCVLGFLMYSQYCHSHYSVQNYSWKQFNLKAKPCPGEYLEQLFGGGLPILCFGLVKVRKELVCSSKGDVLTGKMIQLALKNNYFTNDFTTNLFTIFVSHCGYLTLN